MPRHIGKATQHALFYAMKQHLIELLNVYNTNLASIFHDGHFEKDQYTPVSEELRYCVSAGSIV